MDLSSFGPTCEAGDSTQFPEYSSSSCPDDAMSVITYNLRSSQCSSNVENILVIIDISYEVSNKVVSLSRLSL